MAHLLLDLVVVFAPLSFATIGGGLGAIAGIQHQVVTIRHWMTPEQFVDAFAISRMSPGPSSLLVTLIGWHVAGPAGAIVTTLATFGPTAILVLALAGLWSRTKGARWQVALEAGLRPIAAGLILAAVYVLVGNMKGGWPTRVIAVVSTLVVLRSRVAPLLLLGGGVLLCLGFYSAGLLSDV